MMMTKRYIIAENAVTITVEDDLPAWEMIEARYFPFESDQSQDPTLEVDIKCSSIPECEAEIIYKPEPNEIGPTIATVARDTVGSFIFEFTHESESQPRLWMKTPTDFSRAEIILSPENKNDDYYFLTHALMIAYMLATSANGTLLIHSSCVVYDGKAYLFKGKSGTGKSTHARLWLQNIEGTRLLNDDNPLIRISDDGTPMVYGSPWSGKTPCYRNQSSPIGAFVRIVRSADNELRPLSPLKAYASLTASVAFMPFVSEKLREIRHKEIERLVMTVTCYEMLCRPDADAAQTCQAGLMAND
ncbi:MAG: hypothetical protein K2M93_02995 [Muribaculaceae bacterium]|nr:hypothetical protein [Muribaculaceae bacterium]